MDIRHRLTLINLVLLLMAVTASTMVAVYLLQQQARQQALDLETERLKGTAAIAWNAILNETQRDQSAATYLAARPTVASALASESPGSVHDDLLEPYRRVNGLSFIILVTTLKRPLIEASGVGTIPTTDLGVVLNVALPKQQDVWSFWDGPNSTSSGFPYILAASPVLLDQRLVGTVVVGLRLDNAYVNKLSAELATYQVALVRGGTLLAIPQDFTRALAAAHDSAPFRPRDVAPRSSASLPVGWQIADWQVGSSRYVVVTRPLNYPSNKTFLAIAAPGSGTPWVPHAFFAPVADRLVKQLGMQPGSTFGVALLLTWGASLVALFALLLALGALGTRLALRPMRRLAQAVERFRQDRGWPIHPPLPSGEIGRLYAAVDSLASDSSGWLKRLDEHEDRLESVLNSIQTGVVLSDTAGHVELMNPTARQLLGIDTMATALTVPVTNNGHDHGHRFEATNGRVINAISTPVTRHGGEPAGLVTVLDDLTREHELERVRSDFLSVVSHELRTPLTAVKGSLDLLLDGEAGVLDGLQQRFLHTARRNTERLIGLVSDLLDLSRIEAGQVRLNLNPADVRRIVDDVVVGLSTLFDGKRQQVSTELPTQPLLVLADRRRLEQVVTNLLGNAAIYTPDEGRISVGVWPDTDADEAVISVRDSGPGITPEDREHLFEKFYRGGNALTRQDGGTGLGLAIVKSLVDLHHGTISVESNPGQGATFTVRVPLVGENVENPGR